MKQLIIALVLVISPLLLAGCQGQTVSTGRREEQSSVVTRSGEITIKMGDEWLMTTSEGIVNLASNKVDLDNYLKKKVTVTGMFSGSTLYVDEIE